MADKKISELPNLSNISDTALLVVEYNNKSYNLTGAQWKAYAVEAARQAPGVSPTVTVTNIANGHRVTITDVNGTKSFDVLNGQSGSGSGDMVRSMYDPNSVVANAGGIVGYVNGIVGSINTALDEINGEVV